MEAWQLIVILGAVILAIAFLRPEPKLKGAPQSIAKEMEEAMGYFATDIEEQNGRLLGLFSEMKQQYESQTNKLFGRIESLEKQLFFMQQQMLTELSPNTMSDEQFTDSNPPGLQPNLIAAAQAEPINEVAHEEKKPDEKSAQLPVNIKDRYREIFELYQEGKSIEYVAKKLGMNKGEVQLIVQLARQEEQFRV